MNKFAFDLIDAINRDGLGNESWGVVENVADTVDYFGSKERVSLSGKWAYIYAGKDAVFSLQLDQIEPTMVLHVDGNPMKNNLDNIDGIERAAIRNSRNGEPFVLRGRTYRLVPDPGGGQPDPNLRRYLCLRSAQ